MQPPGWHGRPGDAVGVEIRTEDGSVVIAMGTEVAHVEAGHLGLRCMHIDLDSIGHLRCPIEPNLGDPAQRQRELHALGKKS